MRNLNELQSHCDIEDILNTLKQWSDAKPENKELGKLTLSIIRLISYVSTLETERFSFDRIISESISSKHRAIKRATKAEKQLQQLQEEYKIIKKQIDLGL
jgi:uncharacterized membrane protein YgaE (UPF0421/DUF939 family)